MIDLIVEPESALEPDGAPQDRLILSVDCVLTEHHELMSRVTLFPVEDGSLITDHILNEPRRISIEGFVSDSPITRIPIPGGAASVGAIEEATGASFGVAISNVDAAFRVLEGLHADRVPITVISGLKRYERMVMERLTIPRDRSTGQAMNFSADFVQITLVKLSSIGIPADHIQPGKPTQQACREVDVGKQNPTPVSEGEVKSLLKYMVDDIAELIRQAKAP